MSHTRPKSVLHMGVAGWSGVWGLLASLLVSISIFHTAGMHSQTDYISATKPWNGRRHWTWIQWRAGYQQSQCACVECNHRRIVMLQLLAAVSTHPCVRGLVYEGGWEVLEETVSVQQWNLCHTRLMGKDASSEMDCIVVWEEYFCLWESKQLRGGNGRM